MTCLNKRRLRFGLSAVAAALTLAVSIPDVVLGADEPAKPAIPGQAEIAALLQREPITMESWPSWRPRILDWITDRSRATEPVFAAASNFMNGLAQPAGVLPPPLDQDGLAWYLLGRSFLYEKGTESPVAAAKAEKAYRKSIEIDPTFARAHRNLALSLLMQLGRGETGTPRALEAERELQQAQQLDPTLKLKSVPAQAAYTRNDFATAQKHFREAIAEEPDDHSLAMGLAGSILADDRYVGPKAPEIAGLIARHPRDGELAALHGLALAVDENPSAAVEEFKRARKLGVEPATVLGDGLVQSIEKAAQPGLFTLFLWTMAGFAVVYTVIIGGMSLAGALLGSWTRGTGALKLLGEQPLEIVTGGQVMRTSGEPWLARMYAVGLMLGLVLFYVALPFVALGLLAGTLGAFWLIFQAGRIPVKLVLLIGIVGGGMVWAVLKSMFPKMGSNVMGLLRTEEECPRLFETLHAVAARVDTTPVDEVYLVPGADISVFEEGRGPWGVFGTKRRVLTLGLSTLRTLTIAELESILAHEYAHFSHQDTFYSRFIRRVDISIHTALSGMGMAGGKLNYINPFFWFLVLYYRAYSLLSAGFSRSREFLADRMACSLYGAKVFQNALTKVCTDGPLFESTAYSAVAELMAADSPVPNVYQSFAEFRASPESAEQREKIRSELEQERPSRLASHPTYQERIEAVSGFPSGRDTDTRPAMELFEDPQALEEELSEFIKALIHLSRAQAMAEAG